MSGLIDNLPAALVEIQRLRWWKEGAEEVLDGWGDVFVALGEPGGLGERHYEAALIEVQRLQRVAGEQLQPPFDSTYQRDLGWWVISGQDFTDALRRAHSGEDPGALYLEYYVNADTESVEGRDE